MDGNNYVPTQDKAMALDFMRHITGDAKPNCRLRMKHDSLLHRPSHEVEGDIDFVWPQVLHFQTQGYAVYYFLNEIRSGACWHAEIGINKTGEKFEYQSPYATDADVIKFRGFAVDEDSGLRPDTHLPPSLTVRTSIILDETTGIPIQKGQRIWLVSGGLDEAKFREGQARLAAWYGSDPSVKNPSRLFRLPGTLHLKHPERPMLVTFTAGE